MVLTKKDLKEIKDVVVEATEPYFTAIKGDFNNMEDNFQEVKSTLGDIQNRLRNLERRMVALEDIATEHGKELKKIRVILSQLKKQKKVDQEKVILLEKRIARVEAMVA